MRFLIPPYDDRHYSVRADQNILFVILLWVFIVILFISISEFVIATMATKSMMHESANLEQEEAGSAQSRRSRSVTLPRKVIKAIGTVFGG